MFKQTRTKLNVMYSSLIGCILFIMVLLFYVLLSNTISNNVEKQLNLTSEYILNEWNGNKPSFNKEDQKPVYINYDFILLNQFFILTSENGQVLMHSLRDQQLLSFFTSTLKEQQAASKKVQYTTFVFHENRSFKLFSIENADNSVLYIGMEVTENVSLLNKMEWLLALCAVLLLIVSIGLGYLFSKRAMVPIQRAYQRQQDFVSDASHELRTPLSIMQTSIEIIEEEQTNLSSFHQKVLIDMKAELARVIRMIEGLLTLARSDSGRLEIIREYFDLRNLAQAASESFEILAAQMQIRISCKSAGDGEFMLFGDKERIKQLLYILLDNAIKYNKPGGEISVKLIKKENNVIMQIADTGIGIPQEKIHNIFERFYRIDVGRSRSQGGAGLGLSIAAWIVHAHEGHIKVTSKLDKGTMVQITLPIPKL
jgi:signal transduction histidine kinase